MPSQSASQSLPMSLGRSRTANGGWEWYFVLDGTRIYPSVDAQVGVFTGPETPREEAFRRVLQAWKRVL